MYNIPELEAFVEMIGYSSILSVISAIPGALVGIATYIATSFALYTIATRRGISKPWLAWIPVGNIWIMGSISDHYHLNARYTTKNRRKLLLILQIIQMILGAIFMLSLGVTIISALQAYAQDAPEYIDVWSPVVASLLGILVVWLAMLAVVIWSAVLRYMALYNIYRSCDPSNATLYLVLSIFIQLCEPIFLVICRNKDDGMPKPQPKLAEDVFPKSSENPWEPKSAPTEPWEKQT